MHIGPTSFFCSGYGCNDHFLEEDTYVHCWEVIEELLSDDLTNGILCDIGMPVIHRYGRYNCRVLLQDRKVLGIRPKKALANQGNYRESRWFLPWAGQIETFLLPEGLRQGTGQKEVPFGNIYIEWDGIKIGFEVCEELFGVDNPHRVHAAMDVDILCNGSGSHHELRKLHRRVELIASATKKVRHQHPSQSLILDQIGTSHIR